MSSLLSKSKSISESFGFLSIREFSEARHHKTIYGERRIDGPGALLHRHQIAQFRARDLAAGLEIFDPAKIVIARLGIVFARTGDLDQKLDGGVAMRGVREPGDGLVGCRENSLRGRKIRGRPA